MSQALRGLSLPQAAPYSPVATRVVLSRATKVGGAVAEQRSERADKARPQRRVSLQNRLYISSAVGLR
jgi:hypothetical protein